MRKRESWKKGIATAVMNITVDAASHKTMQEACDLKSHENKSVCCSFCWFFRYVRFRLVVIVALSIFERTSDPLSGPKLERNEVSRERLTILMPQVSGSILQLFLVAPVHWSLVVRGTSGPHLSEGHSLANMEI
jgi:hypothetical protein